MGVGVVLVGHMRMHVPLRFVAVQVTVGTDRHHRVRVRVVPVVVRVRMLVFLSVVGVLVRVPLGQVKQDAGDHQHRGDEHPAAGGPFAQREGQACADEGREGEHGTGARRAEGTLGQQVEAQAESVSGGPDREQCGRRPETREGLAKRPRKDGRGDGGVRVARRRPPGFGVVGIR